MEHDDNGLSRYGIQDPDQSIAGCVPLFSQRASPESKSDAHPSTHLRTS